MKSLLAGGKKALAYRALNMEHEGSGVPLLTEMVGAGVTIAGVVCAVEKVGPFVWLQFTLTAMSLAVTDAGGSGSSASQKLFDFVPQGLICIASRQNYTAFAEDALITTAAGDAAHVLGIGSVAANAGDGALTGTEVDIAPVTGTITDVAGTGAGTKFGGQGSVIDGTDTAVDVYINWSGSAATIDANGVITVTGSIELLFAMLGDD